MVRLSIAYIIPSPERPTDRRIRAISSRISQLVILPLVTHHRTGVPLAPQIVRLAPLSAGPITRQRNTVEGNRPRIPLPCCLD